MIAEQKTYSRLRALPLAGVACLALCGCASSKKNPQPWTPDPQVSWLHVSTKQSPVAENGYTLIAKENTVGLFPANLGVTRVAIEMDDEGLPVPHLKADPRNEFLRWNYTFDDLMAISDVFPVSQRDLGGGEATPEQILAAFHALDAKLALIYAVNQISETESEMFGTLYNARTNQPLASLQAHAVSIKLPEDTKDKDDPYLMWSTDSRAIVRDRFAQALHGCMRELILRDEPPILEDKSGWTPAVPMRPPEWPPRTYRHRRGR